MDEIFEDALRGYLTYQKQPQPKPFRPRTVKGTLVQPDRNLDRTSSCRQRTTRIATTNAHDDAGVNLLVCARERFALSVFKPPSTTDRAMTFLNALLASPRCVRLRPGIRHWDIFTQLCEANSLRGAMIPDASDAALALEYGWEWVSADTDFARFAPLLRWHQL